MEYKYDLKMALRNLFISACALIAMVSVGAFLGQLAGIVFPEGSKNYLLTLSAFQSIIGFAGAALLTGAFISKKPFQYLGITSNSQYPAFNGQKSRNCSSGLKNLGVKPFLGVFLIMLLALPAMNQLVWYNSKIHLPDALSGIELSMRNLEESAMATTQVVLSGTSFVSMISGVFVIGILTPLGEELYFRGALQSILCRDTPLRKWGIWAAAFIFSAAHLQFFGFIPRLLLGAFFGYLFFSTNSIWPSVWAHSLNNSLVVIMTWIGNLRGNPSEFDNLFIVTDGIPWLAIISAILVVLFLYKGYYYFFSSSSHTVSDKNSEMS